MLVLDGAQGHGGGQVLRTGLALSLVTGTPFRIDRIRAGRERPGLLRQHLTCVRAACEIGAAEAEGAELGSTSLTFRPGRVRPGAYRFAVGSAGSVALVLQAVLPALLMADGTFELELEGGTHADHAPPHEFLLHALAPALARMGGRLTLELVRHGFYPAGGGCVRARIEGGGMSPVELLDRGAVLRTHARALVAQIPFDIALREVALLQRKLNLPEADVRGETISGTAGPGNAVIVQIECEHAVEVVSSFGSLRRTAEAVAEQAVRDARRYIAARAPVGEHLADQLVVPLALAGGGAFLAVAASPHAVTVAAVAREFLGVDVRFVPQGNATRVEVGSPARG